MYPAIDQKAIDKAVTVLREGGLVAIPTETVYGLAADADNEEAVMRTFEVKGRPTNHPLIVHVAGIEALYAWAAYGPDEALRLARAFWPGPLTMVLPKSARCGDFVTGGQDSVALRCPSHPWTHTLLEAFSGNNDAGLTAPSANTFGRISPTCASHVAADLGEFPSGKLDYILDGGVCEVGVESTIVNLSGERPEILRHGAITRAMLEAVLERPVPDAGSDAPRASGRLKSHYAPQTKLELLPAEALVARAAELAPLPVAVMARPTTLQSLGDNAIYSVASPDSPSGYAHVLYARLHELDSAEASRILIEEPAHAPEWAAVNDRLGRAAADKSHP